MPARREGKFIPGHNTEFITELAKSASLPAYSAAGNNDAAAGGGAGRAVDGGLIKLGDDRAKLETLNSMPVHGRPSFRNFPTPWSSVREPPALLDLRMLAGI